MKKIAALWLGILIIAWMCLFPPWVATYRPHRDAKATLPLGHSSILYPPERFAGCNWAIDFERLGLLCGIVILVTGGLYYTLTTAGKAKGHETHS